VPEVKRYQTEDLGIPPQNVKPLLLSDNALPIQDGNFRYIFLPKIKTTSIIQPLEEVIILATKRLYRKRFLRR
jgi:hypothetical protein